MKPLRLIEIAGAIAAGALLTRLLPEGSLGYALLAIAGLALLAGVLAAASAQGGTSRRVGTQLVLSLVLGTNRPGAMIADAKALRFFLLGAAAIGGLVLGMFLVPLT